MRSFWMQTILVGLKAFYQSLVLFWVLRQLQPLDPIDSVLVALTSMVMYLTIEPKYTEFIWSDCLLGKVGMLPTLGLTLVNFLGSAVAASIIHPPFDTMLHNPNTLLLIAGGTLVVFTNCQSNARHVTAVTIFLRGLQPGWFLRGPVHCLASAAIGSALHMLVWSVQQYQSHIKSD